MIKAHFLNVCQIDSVFDNVSYYNWIIIKLSDLCFDICYTYSWTSWYIL